MVVTVPVDPSCIELPSIVALATVGPQLDHASGSVSNCHTMSGRASMTRCTHRLRTSPSYDLGSG